MVLCPGKNTAHADSSQAKSQLHIPWKLLSERLRVLANSRASDGSAQKNPIENRLISVPYEGESINWNLTSGTVQATVKVDTATIDATSAQVSIPSAQIEIVLEQINVDQVIEKEIGGVKVHVHLQAACGPIQIHQPAARAVTFFNLAWTNGSPTATLSSLDLSWAPQSWTFNEFTCTGPSGLDTVIRDGVASYLRDPASLKSYIESYIADNLKAQIEAVLAKLRAPLAVGSRHEPITLQVGALAPVSTGVIADLTLKTDSKSTAGPAGPLPSTSVLSSLSRSEPSLIGDLSVIQFIVDTKLRAQAPYYRFDLQTLPSFNKLMHNRVAQLFAWRDLWHYSSSSPFYLTIFKPSALKLSRGSGNVLTSNVPVKSMIQSYREKAWWVYVQSRGEAATSVAISVSSGALKYETAITTLDLNSKYGDAYIKAFHKDADDKVPDALVEKAVAGSRPELSGTMIWPIVDLDAGGKYRVSSLTWIDRDTFSLRFSSIK